MKHFTRTLAPIVAFFSLVLSVSVPAAEVKFQEVAPGIYAFVGETEGRTYDNEGLNANVGLVVTAQGAVLIDSGASYQGAQQLAEAARKVTDQPIKWVINTGGQDHRWLGNGYFQSQGAEIIAHANAEQDMKSRGPEHLQALKPILKDKLNGTVLTLPSTFLQGPDNRMEWGKVVLEIKHRQGGHTPGDSMVWLPQSQVLFSGDVVYVDRMLGLHKVSNTRNWLSSFAVIDELKPRIIVPGHGRVTDLQTAQKSTRDLLQALRNHAAQDVQNGVDIGASVQSFDSTPFNHLQHADVWLPQLIHFSYLEAERE